MNVVVLEDAARDIEAGREFYAAREFELGEYFIQSILGDLVALEIYAGVHPTHFGFHRMLSKRFPFGIYNQVEDGTACVYGILDMRRNPSSIQAELGTRR